MSKQKQYTPEFRAQAVRFVADRPNQLWVSDFTYAHAPEKFVVVVNACELVGARAAIPEEVGDQLCVKVFSACAWCRFCVDRGWLRLARSPWTSSSDAR